MKVALVGPGGCGKSALAVRILSRRFISDYCPVLEDTYYRADWATSMSRTVETGVASNLMP